jgi:LysR family transcriptional regulator, transcription activator of glutamate synthase operon
MDLRQIQYFLAIVEHGSFTEAADFHFISQSSLSKRIIALEEELGVTLFDRSKRNVSLTQAGEAFLIYAQQLGGTFQSMIFDMENFKVEKEYISIGAIPVITEYGIPGLIARFRTLKPKIEFQMVEVDGINILPALDKLLFDLAITRQNYLDYDKYEAVLISEDQFLVTVSKHHPFADRKSVSLKELKGQNFIVFDQVTGLQRVIFDECNKFGYEPTIFYSSHQKISVLGLVGANIGIALLPIKIYEYHKNPEVTEIALEEDLECNIVLAYLKNRRLSMASKEFVDFLENTDMRN